MAMEIAGTGEIVAVAGMDDVTVGVTYTDPDAPRPLPPIEIDPPTLSMNFIPNDSPFAGKEGSFVTSRDLEERLRREGYEFQVTRPQVILKHEGGELLEPYEELTIDVEEQHMGTAIEMLGNRKGQMREMHQGNGMARIVYRIPTRGLPGFRSEFLSATRGMGIMNYLFSGYGPHAGEIRNRKKGVLVVKGPCTTVAYALFNLQERGRLFYGPGARAYAGQILGEHCRENDLVVNPAKGKKLTNIRAAGSDENVVLTTPVHMSLEACISYLNDDELVEITPQAVRLRKRQVSQ